MRLQTLHTALRKVDAAAPCQGELEPEERLILCCARSSISKTAASAIDSFLQHGLDWDRVLALTAYHRVTPLVYQTLSRSVAERIPERFLLDLRSRLKFNTIANLYRTRELLQLIPWLRDAGINSLPYKGPALAFVAYGDISLREFHDLDLLVDSRDYIKTQELLLAAGYRIKKSVESQTALVSLARGITIGLHQALVPDHFPVRLTFERLTERSESIALLGGRLTTFSDEDLLLFLCIQISKDVWQPARLRLNKFCDIAELSRARPNLDWEAVRKEAQHLGCERILNLGLSAASELLEAPIPGVNHVDTGAKVRAHVIGRLFERQGPDNQQPFLSANAFHFQIRERWREKLYPAYRYIFPGKKDFAFVRLPESLTFLYYVVRPVRLARDFSRRGWEFFSRSVIK